MTSRQAHDAIVAVFARPPGLHWLMRPCTSRICPACCVPQGLEKSQVLVGQKVVQLEQEAVQAAMGLEQVRGGGAGGRRRPAGGRAGACFCRDFGRR